LKVVLDESVPEGLADCFPGHDVHTSTSLGWKGIKNGRLLKLVESIGTEAFITSDKSMEKQQVFQGRPFRRLMLSTNSWPLIQDHVLVIAQALDTAELSVVTQVECGRFVPRKHRKPAP
jgi:hypothetical protein